MGMLEHDGRQGLVVHSTVAELCEGIQSTVSGQLAMAQQALARNHERCLCSMAMHIANLHKVDRQVKDLQQENQRLRDELKRARSMACTKSSNFGLPGNVSFSDETNRSPPNRSSMNHGHDLASVPVPVLLLSRL